MWVEYIQLLLKHANKRRTLGIIIEKQNALIFYRGLG